MRYARLELDELFMGELSPQSSHRFGIRRGTAFELAKTPRRARSEPQPLFDVRQIAKRTETAWINIERSLERFTRFETNRHTFDGGLVAFSLLHLSDPSVEQIGRDRLVLFGISPGRRRDRD